MKKMTTGLLRKKSSNTNWKAIEKLIWMINYGVKRNGKKVLELPDMGANPMIDPDEKSSVSEILAILDGHRSYHLINIVDVYVQMKTGGYDSFGIRDYSRLILELYSAASSEKLFNIINSRLKNQKPELS